MLLEPVMFTEVALVAETVRVEELPELIVAGLALIVTVGPGFTVTVVEADVEPPFPVAVAV